MKICVVAGHTMKGKGTGASKYINESTENRVVSKLVVEYLKKAGHEVDYYAIDEATDYLAKQVNFANKKKYDLVVQIHFNAGGGTGTETLYKTSTGKKYAEQVTKSLGKLYKQRGAKVRTDLYWLNKTNAPAILVEVCFVDSTTDTNIYNANKPHTAKLIAEGIIGQEIIEKPVETPVSNKKYGVRVHSFSTKEKALEFSKMLKEKHNAYSEVYEVN
jgi:N-acetylmuramoyl-L-alanine amidase